MKLHEILIGVAFVAFCFGGFLLLFTDSVAHYGATGLDTTTLSKINNSLNDLDSDMTEVKGAMEDLQGISTATDIFGSLVVGGYGAVKTASTGSDIILTIGQTSMDYIPFGNYQRLFFLLFGVVLTIIIFIAILGHFLSKSERI